MNIYIHDSVFPSQGHEKVYLFKMLVNGLGSGVHLVRWMQLGGDLQNCFVMFDHVKWVKSLTNIACNIYCRAYFHEKCLKHYGHKGDPGVTFGTCGDVGERAQVILV